MAMLGEDFVGREKEIALIREWLASAGASPIMYFCDGIEEQESKGGIGKTWLLRKIFEIIQQQPNVIPIKIDFFTVADRDGVVIAERIINAIKARYSGWEAERFEPLLQIYHQGERGEKVEMANLRGQLAEALESDLQSLRPQLVKDKTLLLIIFDTYELIEQNPITAVLRPTRPFPDTYQFDRVRVIIAGRNILNWHHQNWVGREKEVDVCTLSPFRYEEAERYLRARLYSLDNYVPYLKKIYEKTQGRPILLGLITDVLNRIEVDLKTLLAKNRSKFEESLVWQINQFESQVYWLILIMSHIHHRFNESLIERIRKVPGFEDKFSTQTTAELRQDLLDLSFVKGSDSTSSDMMLHDEMRRLVNKHCWSANDPMKQIRRELSTLAQGYYDELIENEKEIEIRQGYVVEKLFHDLFLDVDTGFKTFLKLFDEAIARSIRTHARALYEEAQRFASELSNDQRRALRFAEARVLREEENHASALEIIASLESGREWIGQNRLMLLEEKANCYLGQSDYAEATRYLKECLEIEKAEDNLQMKAHFLNRLGYLHRLQGKYYDAMQYYNSALLMHRGLDDQAEYANILNNIAYVQRLNANLEDALRTCKLALRIRRDLFKEQQLSEYYVGLSLSTMGHIYHSMDQLESEEKAFVEAFQIYHRVSEISAIANTYNRLGRIKMLKGSLEKAREDFKHATRMAVGRSREVEIESLNQLGRLDLHEEKWQDAVDNFEKAVAYARQVGQNFELAENLLYLASAIDRLKNPSRERISELIKESKQLSRKNRYIFLLGLAGQIQGDIYLRKQEYLSAFRHYRVYCRYMAERGAPEYNHALHRINDMLLVIPRPSLPAAVDSLLSYWNELGLSEKYPELPKICREVSMHMLL